MAIEVYKKTKYSIQLPTKKHGAAIHALVGKSPPLDLNSTYHYLLQSHYFAKTSAVVFYEKELVAFISGFISPLDKKNLFIWQVAIAEQYRGQGLGGRMVDFILANNRQVEFLETTVTRENTSSRRMFEKISHQLEANLTEKILFESESDFLNQHDSEYLIRIGPINHKGYT